MLDEHQREHRGIAIGAKCVTQYHIRNVQRFDPGPALYEFLGDLIDPGDVQLSEWFSEVTSTREKRSGKVLFVLPGHILMVAYTDVINDPHRLPMVSMGSIEVTRHRKAAHSIKWAASDIDPDRPGVAGGAIEITGEGWSVKLPYTPIPATTGPDYFAEVVAAFDPAPSHRVGGL